MPNLPTAPAFQSGRVPGLPVTSGDLDIVKIAAVLVMVALVLAGLYDGRDILIPLAIAFLITFTLNLPVTWFVRRWVAQTARD